MPTLNTHTHTPVCLNLLCVSIYSWTAAVRLKHMTLVMLPDGTQQSNVISLQPEISSHTRYKTHHLMLLKHACTFITCGFLPADLRRVLNSSQWMKHDWYSYIIMCLCLNSDGFQLQLKMSVTAVSYCVLPDEGKLALTHCDTHKRALVIRGGY